MPTGFFTPIASTAALFSKAADESDGTPEKSLPSRIFIPSVFARSTSVVKPEKIISAFAGLPFQSGAGILHQISVMGERVLATELIIPVLINSCFIIPKFFCVSGVAAIMIRLSGS